MSLLRRIPIDRTQNQNFSLGPVASLEVRTSQDYTTISERLKLTGTSLLVVKKIRQAKEQETKSFFLFNTILTIGIGHVLSSLIKMNSVAKNPSLKNYSSVMLFVKAHIDCEKLDHP